MQKEGCTQLHNKLLAYSLLVTDRLVNARNNFRPDEISNLFPTESNVAIWTRIFVQWFIVRLPPTRPSPQVVIRTWRKHWQVHLCFVHKFLHNAVHIILHTSPFFVKSNRFSTGLLQLWITWHEVSMFRRRVSIPTVIEALFEGEQW